MKALKYTGLKPGQHTDIYDARSVEDWYETQRYDEEKRELVIERCEPDTPGAKHHFCDGENIRINPGDIVPIDRFQNSPHSGDVVKVHTTPLLDTDGRLIRPPLAVIVEIDENGAEIASPAAAQPVASPVSAFRRRASGGAAESAADDKKES